MRSRETYASVVSVFCSFIRLDRWDAETVSDGRVLDQVNQLDEVADTCFLVLAIDCCLESEPGLS